MGRWLRYARRRLDSRNVAFNVQVRGALSAKKSSSAWAHGDDKQGSGARGHWRTPPMAPSGLVTHRCIPRHPGEYSAALTDISACYSPHAVSLSMRKPGSSSAP